MMLYDVLSFFAFICFHFMRLYKLLALLPFARSARAKAMLAQGRAKRKLLLLRFFSGGSFAKLPPEKKRRRSEEEKQKPEQKERWLSGRKRLIANPLYDLFRTEGSNPSLSVFHPSFARFFALSSLLRKAKKKRSASATEARALRFFFALRRSEERAMHLPPVRRRASFRFALRKHSFCARGASKRKERKLLLHFIFLFILNIIFLIIFNISFNISFLYNISYNI